VGLFDFLIKPEQDVHLVIPSVEIQFNHKLKIALLYHDDPDMPKTAYDALEAHLARRGYILQIIIAPVISRHRG